MSLKLMYITNDPEIAVIAERNGVDRIFIDMEYIGKDKRQGSMDSVKNHHTVFDIRRVREAIKKAELLVRINPVHDAMEQPLCSATEREIEEVIEAGADIIMLPYYKTIEEVKRFLSAVKGRKKTVLLLETAEAVEILDEVLLLDGIDEIFIGLNDLSLSYNKKFMFEVLENGLVEELCRRFEKVGMFYGFGGIASLGKGDVPAELIIKEHYRLGSKAVILSRSFCNTSELSDLQSIENRFRDGIMEIRELEKECAIHRKYFTENEEKLHSAINRALERKKAMAS